MWGTTVTLEEFTQRRKAAMQARKEASGYFFASSRLCVRNTFGIKM
jgi:hypothetical protein